MHVRARPFGRALTRLRQGTVEGRRGGWRQNDAGALKSPIDERHLFAGLALVDRRTISCDQPQPPEKSGWQEFFL